MQMSISNSSPSAAPAAAGPASASAADSGNFNQAFIQMMAGLQGNTVNAQTGGDAVASMNTVSATSLASLLNGSLTATDMLSAIEALLQKLDEIKPEDLVKTTTESDLADALSQLDNLLSALMGVPLIQQSLNPQPNEPLGNASSDSEDDSNSGIALMSMMANVNAASAVTIQAAESAVPDQAQGVVASLEEIMALKSGLQEALTDLKSVLQQQKGTALNQEQTTLISDGLNKVGQLFNDRGSLAVANAADVNAANTNPLLDAAPQVQTMPQGSAHLQRMGQQLLHAGLLNVVKTPEENELSTAPLQGVEDGNGFLPQVHLAGMEVERQQSFAVKTVVQQPVPVQQFASTVEGLVVKQFNVTAGNNGLSQAQLTLYPEHLGQVNVNISVQNGTLTAQFVTDTVTAKDMLENQMAQLRSALQAQGLQVDKLVVSQTSVLHNPFQDRHGQQGQQQQTGKRNKSQDDVIGEIDFANDLEQLSTQQAVDRDLGLGRGIHTIA